MEFTARQLAQILNGNVEGDENATATSFAKIEHGKKGQLSFYANPKYEQYVYSSKASIMLVNKDFEPKSPVSATLVRVDNAYSALADLLKYVAAQNRSHKRHRSLFTAIPCSAKIGRKVSIGAHCHIGKKCRIGDYSIIEDNVCIGENTRIGKNCIFYSGVRIYPNSVIGNNVILHSGCVVGSDGFGNAPQPDGTWQKIEHLGNVVIGDDVELGANTCVDRAPMESTIIGNGVKIDNLCHIAHNVQIGDNTVMAAQSGIAGSTVIGKNCMIAGQVGIVGHIKIADNTTVCAKSGVIGNVRQPGQVIFGIPAIDRALYLKSFALFKQAGQEK